MKCPLVIDYVRECVPYIGQVMDPEALLFCTNEKYVNCPFYKMVNKIGTICQFASSCRRFKATAVTNYDKFLKMTTEYCLSECHINCPGFSEKILNGEE